MALIALDAHHSQPLWCDHHHDNSGSIVALTSLFERGLSKVAVSREELAAIAVSVGPGSFTGIKVGLAFSYGLKTGLAREPQMLGLSSLEEAARRGQRQQGRGSYALFLPATRTHGFLGVADDQGKVSSTLIDVSPENHDHEALDLLPENASLMVVGGWPLCEEWLLNRGRSPLQLPASTVCEAAIYGMADRAMARWPGDYTQDIPQPRYLRLSTAEEKLQAGPRMQGGNKL